MMDAIISSYITAFLLGLFSTVHCIAMCGSVIGALTLSLPAEVRESQRRMLPFVFNYNVGRILSYAIAGVVVGLLSTPLTQLNAHWVLRVLSVLVMVSMGLYLAGWFPKFARAEKLGAPVWRMLQPIGQKLLPVRSVSQAFLLGMVWGWLPCGLVYAALAVAATAGDPVKGGLVMLAFGAGTLPAVMGAGLFTGMLASLARSKSLRQVAGVLIILMALATLLWPLSGHQEHQHSNHTHGVEQGQEAS
jgi:sulfite exporter TauE/SafE